MRLRRSRAAGAIGQALLLAPVDFVPEREFEEVALT
jgi:hypothetical protein